MSEWKETEIGLIPKDWHYVPFQSVLSQSLRNGIYKSNEYHGRGTRVVNMGEMFAFDKLPSIEMSRIELSNDELEKSCVLEGDLLFARRSLVAEGAGKCTLVLKQEEALTFESSIIRARPDAQKADSAYLQYLFSSRIGKYLLRTILRQVAVSGITGADLARLKLPLPSLEEQKKASHLLSCLDRKIENLRRQNETLEEIARSIFKHWFINFEFPNADGKPYKSSGGVMVRSELGDIPEGWHVGKLGDIASFNNGKSPPERSDIFNIPIYGSNGVIGQANTSNHDNIVVIGRVGSYCGSLYYFLDRCWVTDNAMVGKLRKGSSHSFLYLLLQIIGLNRLSTGSGQPLLNQSILSSIEWVLPVDSYIESFGAVVKPFFQKMLLNKNQVQILTKTRDALLPKLMSGQIRVEE